MHICLILQAAALMKKLSAPAFARDGEPELQSNQILRGTTLLHGITAHSSGYELRLRLP
jgi:hypothetical protein